MKAKRLRMRALRRTRKPQSPGRSRPGGRKNLSRARDRDRPVPAFFGMMPWPRPSAVTTELGPSLSSSTILAKTVLLCALFCAAQVPAEVIPGQERPAPSDLLASAARNGEKVASALRGYSYYAELTIPTI